RQPRSTCEVRGGLTDDGRLLRTASRPASTIKSKAATAAGGASTSPKQPHVELPRRAFESATTEKTPNVITARRHVHLGSQPSIRHAPSTSSNAASASSQRAKSRQPKAALLSETPSRIAAAFKAAPAQRGTPADATIRQRPSLAVCAPQTTDLPL